MRKPAKRSDAGVWAFIFGTATVTILYVLGSLALTAFIVIAAVHFILKFW